MRTRIVCLLPRNSGAGVNQLRRLANYLEGTEVEEIVAVTTDSQVDQTGAALGPKRQGHAGYELRPGQPTVQHAEETDLKRVLGDADVLVVWDSAASQPLLDTGVPVVPVFRLRGNGSLEDHRTLIQLSSLLRGNMRQHAAASLTRMRQLRDTFDPETTATILLGTDLDPELRQPTVLVTETDCRLGASATTQVVHQIIWVATPESHIGSLTHTPEPLGHLLDDELTTLVVPMWAYGHLSAAWPDAVDRIIGIPIDETRPLGSSLQAGFAVSDLDPVGPRVLLPVAEYISKHILIAVQGPVDGSSDEWASSLLAIEKRGGVVSVAGECDQRELTRRLERSCTDYVRPSGQTRPDHLLIAVNPDWVDEMGHHAHFDRALSEAVQATNGELISLTSNALEAESVQQVPTFSHSTYGFSASEGAIFVQTFERELDCAIRSLLTNFPDVPIRVAMYSAAIPHLVALINIAAALDESRLSFFVNLLRSHNDLLDMQEHLDPSPEIRLLDIALSVGPSVGVYTMADTDAIADLLESTFGCRLPMWPMFGVTPLAEETESRPPSAPPVVCYPATQEIKGLSLFTEFAEAVAAREGEPSVRMVARDVGHQPQLMRRLRNAGVELTPGVLSPAAYTQLMRSADIIVLPYRSRPFQIQTSGVFADAVRLRIPAVATRSTWAGELIDENGIGATFEESDLEGFLSAVDDVVANHEAYRQTITAFARRWLAQNNPTALFEAFRRVESSGSPRQPDVAGASFLRSLWELIASNGRATQDIEIKLAERLDHAVIALRSDLERLDQKIHTRNRTIDRLEARIVATRDDRDKRLAALREQMARYEGMIEKRDRDLATLRERLEAGQDRVEGILADYSRTKTNLQTRIETRDATITSLRAALAAHAVELQATTKRYEKRIQVLKDGVAKRDAAIAGLNRRFSVKVGNKMKQILGSGE